jgi:hypothetical protein
MKKEELEKLVHGLNTLITDFKFEEALEKYYDDAVITVENENPPTVGLPAYKQSAKKILVQYQ